MSYKNREFDFRFGHPLVFARVSEWTRAAKFGNKALSLRERVSRSGAFTSRSGTGEGSVPDIKFSNHKPIRQQASEEDQSGQGEAG